MGITTAEAGAGTLQVESEPNALCENTDESSHRVLSAPCALTVRDNYEDSATHSEPISASLDLTLG